MATIKSEGANAALALANRNIAQLQHMAWLSINEFDCSANETVVICAQNNTTWSDLLLELNPDASRETAEIVASGGQPISIMCTTISDLSDFLGDTTLDIELPPPPPDSERANLLVLTSDNQYTWLWMVPRSNPSLLS